jgi:hypothetical protein
MCLLLLPASALPDMAVCTAMSSLGRPLPPPDFPPSQACNTALLPLATRPFSRFPLLASALSDMAVYLAMSSLGRPLPPPDFLPSQACNGILLLHVCSPPPRYSPFLGLLTAVLRSLHSMQLALPTYLTPHKIPTSISSSVKNKFSYHSAHSPSSPQSLVTSSSLSKSDPGVVCILYM